jgi:hypothetical protein
MFDPFNVQYRYSTGYCMQWLGSDQQIITAAGEVSGLKNYLMKFSQTSTLFLLWSNVDPSYSAAPLKTLLKKSDWNQELIFID